MAFIKKIKVRILTPNGSLHYPALTSPDTKFADTRKPDGEYKAGVILDPTDEATMKLVASLEKVRDDYRQERIDACDKPADAKKLERFSVRPVFTEQLDDDGDVTGNIVVKASQAATIVAKTGKTHHFGITVVDSQLKKVNQPVWSGSEGILSVDASGYDMQTDKSFGVSLSLVGCQVTKLVSGAGGGDDTSGFGVVAGGFVETAPVAVDADDAEGESDIDF